MNKVKIITPPATELLSTDDAKVELKIDHTDEDAVILRKIKAARSQIEAWCGIAIGEQTLEWLVDFEAYYPRTVVPVGRWMTVNGSAYGYEKEFPVYPLIEIVSASYQETDYTYTEKTLVDDYNSRDGYFLPVSSGRWKVRFTAGYTAEDLPDGLKDAWLQLVVHKYTNRMDENVRMPDDIKYNLQPYKRSLI